MVPSILTCFHSLLISNVFAAKVWDAACWEYRQGIKIADQPLLIQPEFFMFSCCYVVKLCNLVSLTLIFHQVPVPVSLQVLSGSQTTAGNSLLPESHDFGFKSAAKALTDFRVTDRVLRLSFCGMLTTSLCSLCCNHFVR